MKVLIAIESCLRDRHLHAAHRNTWVRELSGADLKFFMGGTGTPEPDEEFLPVADDYISLPFKTKTICHWAIARGYDYLFKADSDTFIHPGRLLASGFEKYEYTGFYLGHPRGEGYDWVKRGAYASGGSGYWLCRRAMEFIAGADLKQDYIDPQKGSTLGEDLQVGRVLSAVDIECYCDPRYHIMVPGPKPNNDVITLHDVILPIRNAERFDLLYQGMHGFR